MLSIALQSLALERERARNERKVKKDQRKIQRQSDKENGGSSGRRPTRTLRRRRFPRRCERARDQDSSGEVAPVSSPAP